MTITLTPFDFSNVKKLGPRRYRKQILPIGSINYQGQRVTFDKPFLMDLAKAHANSAYDQVPFQLADGKNRHNEDPRHYAGEVVGLELTNDGLDAILELTEDGEKLVQKNPRLGVSARIMQGLVKSDGRVFNRAIRHVLATLDPKVTGLRPWQAVDLAVYNDLDEVVDLTAETYREEGNTKMAKTTLRVASKDPKSKTATIDLSELTDDQFESLLEFSVTPDEDPDADEDEDGDEVDETEDELDPDEEDEDADEEDPEDEDEKPKSKRQKLKRRKTTTKVEEEMDNDTDKVLASLSNDVAGIRKQAAQDRYQAARTDYISAGVPPFIVDLAEPVLAAATPVVIDLSESGGEKVNATEVVTKILDGFKGMIDFTPEAGHAIELSETPDDDPDKALLEEWSSTYGN